MARNINGFGMGADVIYEHRTSMKNIWAIPKGTTAHHKNGDMFDNRPENLEAVRPVDNGTISNDTAATRRENG